MPPFWLRVFGLLIETANASGPASSETVWLTDREMGDFAGRLENALARGFQLLGWQCYDFEVEGDTPRHPDELRAALQARSRPPALVSSLPLALEPNLFQKTSTALIRQRLFLHCINTYKDGCSASEARQAVGGRRGAVVRGTNLAEAIHRLALWVGGLSTAVAVCTLRQGLSVRTEYQAGLQLPPRQQHWRSTDDPPGQADAHRIAPGQLERLQ